MGSPEQIYNQPANQLVAGFIGSPQMNFLRVPCEGDRAIVGGGYIPLPRGVVGSKEVMLGIRPEHVHLDPSPQESTFKVKPFSSKTWVCIISSV
ncbi:MAG: hypothetical protein HC780_21330 [Leptolyngbyaceae cyanobacterium CSU_1_3]|nr:hypothetical protein [Leptolyngbyaceae cyanobacterium CSU_1_3]